MNTESILLCIIVFLLGLIAYLVWREPRPINVTAIFNDDDFEDEGEQWKKGKREDEP